MRVWRSILRIIGGGLSFGSWGRSYCVKVGICFVLKDIGFGEDELILSNGVSVEVSWQHQPYLGECEEVIMDAEHTGAGADRGGEQQPYGARSHGAISRNLERKRRVRAGM